MSWTVAQVAMAVSSQATRPRVGSVLSLIGVRRLPVSRGAVSFVSAAPDFVTWGKLSPVLSTYWLLPYIFSKSVAVMTYEMANTNIGTQ